MPLSAVLIATAIAVAACGAPRPASPTPSPSPATASPTTSPVAALDRLQIASIRARAYPASTLTTLKSDGDAGGFTEAVVSYQSDGFAVHALLAIPDGARPASGWPAVIVEHGYVNPAQYVTDDASYADFIAAFAHAGDLVIKPDDRGNGESQGVPEGGHFSPVYAYDLLTLISTLRADPRVDPSRIGIFAHSMGGHEALRAMVVSPDIRAVVFMAGVVGSFHDIFDDWPNSPVTTDQPAIVQQLREQEIAAHGTPDSDPAYWASCSAITFVSSVTAAVQVNQDVDDSVVPKLFADHLVAALQAAGKSVTYIQYPGDDHQFTANRAAVLHNATAFFAAHL